MECNICFENIGDRNSSVTKCGHHFCFSCITTAMHYSINCPCCRTQIMENPNVHNNNEMVDYTLDHISNMGVGNIDDVARHLEQKGVTMIDVLSYYNNRYNSRGINYQMINDTWLYMIEWLEDIIPRTIQEVDDLHLDKAREQYERYLFRMEDRK
jgi:hypothetical protein